MKTLALVMIVKNEERCLEKCLYQAKKLVDKIYITDTGSTDRTKEIAASYGAIISDYAWTQDFAAARNFSLDQSDCDWNLVLDADEYLVKGRRKDLRHFLENMEQVGMFERKDFYLEKTLDSKEQMAFSYTQVVRLLPRGVRFTGRIHEQENSSLPARPVPLVFEHDGYLQEGKGERNLPILLAELEEDLQNPYFLYKTATALRGLKRCEEACDYFSKFYQLAPIAAPYRPDGIFQYMYTLLELQDYDTALHIAGQEELRLAAYADYHFTCGILYMRAAQADTAKYIAYFPLIEQAFQQCLKIGEISSHEGVYGCGSFRAAYNLGVWYEVTGDLQKALQYYKQAARHSYPPALERLSALR